MTALFATKEFYRGDIITHKKFKINYPIMINDVIKKVELLYFDIIYGIYTLILNNKKISAKKQNEEQASYSLWLDEKDYFIDWKKCVAKKIRRFVDAIKFPYDNAKAYLNGKIIKFIDVKVVDNIKIEHRKRHIGKILAIKNACPIVICKKGLLKLIDTRDIKNKKIAINFRSRFE